MINILSGEKFNPNIKSNPNDIGFRIIKVDIKKNKKISLNFRDLPNQEKFKPFIEKYLSSADCVIIGYDINNKTNFEEAKNNWYQEAKKIKEFKLMYFIGNKIDLNEFREVDKEEANEFAKSNNLRFFEISCKTGEGIEEFYNDLVLNLLK